jgi:hypothetical protein
MQAPPPLLDRLAALNGMGAGRRRLVLLLSQLGDFDTLEYAQALVPLMPRLADAAISPLAIAIGNQAGADRFCAYTGFPRDSLLVDAEPHLHRALGHWNGLAPDAGGFIRSICLAHETGHHRCQLIAR